MDCFLYFSSFDLWVCALFYQILSSSYKGAGGVPTLQMRKLSLGAVNALPSLPACSPFARAPSVGDPAAFSRAPGQGYGQLCVDISFLSICLASSVTKALSGDRPVCWWHGEAPLGEGNMGCVGPPGRRGGQRAR